MRDFLDIEFEDIAEEGSVNLAVEAYFSVELDDYRDPVTRVIDFESFREDKKGALNSLSPEGQERALSIIRNNLTPKQLEYKEAVDAIDESKYWDIRDIAWEQVRGATPGLPETPEQFIRLREQELRTETLLNEDAVRVFASRHPILTGYGRIRDGLRRVWKAKNPTIIRLLDLWGYNRLDLADLPLLATVNR